MLSPLRLRAAAVVAACALLPLAGCAQGAPSDAAVVGDQVIKIDQVTTNVEGLARAFGTPADQINVHNVVGAMISGAQADQVAAAHHITVTDAQRDKALSSEESGRALMADPTAKALAYDLADAQIVSQQIGVEKYLEEAKTIPVKLNPRYGTWQDGQMAGDSGSLSEAVSPSSMPTS